MPRANRLPPLPYACYYYRRKCARGRAIARDREELELIFEALNIALRRSDARLYAFHIDSNEFHFVVRAGRTALLPALGVFCHEVTRRMNGRRRESGQLFRQRPQATVLQAERWLLPVAHYVHSLRRLCDFELSWNSDDMYRAHQRKTGLTTTGIVRSLLAAVEDSSGWECAYSGYFDAPIPPGEGYLIEHGSPEDSRILGDRKFIARVLRADGSAAILDAVAHESPDQVIRRAAEVVIPRFHMLCRQYLSVREARDWIVRTNLEQLRAKSRRMPLPFVRGMIADYAVMRGLARGSEIEKFFGLQPRSLATGLRRRYRSRILARLCGRSGVAPHSIPYIECGIQ